MKKGIARFGNCGIAKLNDNWPLEISQLRIVAILHLLLFATLTIPLSASAQTTTVATPTKVTVTLVRWPYT